MIPFQTYMLKSVVEKEHLRFQLLLDPPANLITVGAYTHMRVRLPDEDLRLVPCEIDGSAASAPRMPGSEWPTESRAPKRCAGRKRRADAHSEERNAA